MTVQEQVDYTRKDIENTQDNTVDMLDQSIDVGANTNAQLGRQGEQLRNARADMQDIKVCYLYQMATIMDLYLQFFLIFFHF